MKKYYPGGIFSIHLQLIINIIQNKNLVVTKKTGKGKLPLFHGNGEQVIPIYVNRRARFQPNLEGFHVTI